MSIESQNEFVERVTRAVILRMRSLGGNRPLRRNTVFAVARHSLTNSSSHWSLTYITSAWIVPQKEPIHKMNNTVTLEHCIQIFVSYTNGGAISPLDNIPCWAQDRMYTWEVSSMMCGPVCRWVEPMIVSWCQVDHTVVETGSFLLT